MKKSAIRGYANQLLLTTIRCSENVDFLAKYAKVDHAYDSSINWIQK